MLEFIGATAGAASSFAGNVMNYFSQKEANQTNREIAQMNNEFNERMMQKQMDYNTEMWNKENEYNTPANQVQRLRDAGLNPALVGNLSSGQAGSANSVTPAQAQGVTVQPSRFDFSPIGQAMQEYARYKQQERVNDANIQYTDAKAQEQNIRNETARARAFEELEQMKANSRSGKARAHIDEVQSRMAQDMLNADYKRKQLDNKSIEQQIEGQSIQNLMLSKELAFLDQKQKLYAAGEISRIALMKAQGKLTDKQAELETERILHERAKTQGQDISNRQASAMAPYLLRKANIDAGLGGANGILGDAARIYFGLGFKVGDGVRELFK